MRRYFLLFYALTLATFSQAAAADVPADSITADGTFLEAGYYPTTDCGISLGAAIINKEKTQLGLSGQFDNNTFDDSYRVAPDAATENPIDFQWLDLTFGAKFLQKFEKANSVGITTDFSYSKWTLAPFFSNELVGTLSRSYDLNDTGRNLRWHINAAYTGHFNDRLEYGLSAGGGVFRNLKNRDADKPAYYYSNLQKLGYATLNQEATYNFATWIKAALNDSVSLGADIDGNFVHFNSFLTPTEMLSTFYYGANGGSNIAYTHPAKTVGIINISPSAEFDNGLIYGKLGARFGLSVNSGNTLHVAPDVLFGVKPSSLFEAWIKLGGGVYANTLEHQFAISRYADQRLAYNLSNLPFTGQLGLRVDPFKGASLKAMLDYASANDWLMPLQYSSLYCFSLSDELIYGYGLNLLAPTTLRAWKLELQFDYACHDWFDLSADYQTSLGNGQKHNWIHWADRARHVVTAEISLHPGEFADVLSFAKPLGIDVSFEGRFKRSQYIIDDHIYSFDPANQILNFPLEKATECYSYSLPNNSSLSIGAHWDFSDHFGIFGSFENILNRSNREIFNLPGQSFQCLIGFSYHL